jgi:hypothetical protein
MEEFQSIRLKNKALKILKKWSYQMDMPYSEAIIEVDKLKNVGDSQQPEGMKNAA